MWELLLQVVTDHLEIRQQARRIRTGLSHKIVLWNGMILCQEGKVLNAVQFASLLFSVGKSHSRLTPRDSSPHGSTKAAQAQTVSSLRLQGARLHLSIGRNPWFDRTAQV